MYTNLLDELQEVDNSRKQARQRVLKSEQEHEAAFRSIERIKFAAIGNQFPGRSETGQYIFAQLLTDQECIVCGNNVPEVEAEYANRIENAQCVVCGSERTEQDLRLETEDGASINNIKQSTIQLRQIEEDLVEARSSLHKAEANYELHIEQINKLREKIKNHTDRIDLLVSKLPPEEAALNEHRTRLDLMRERVKELKEQLAGLREQFGIFVKKVNLDIVQSKEAIKTSFNKYAEGFLIEKCLLTWAPHKATVGQSGSRFSFPSFELELGGTDFPLPVRRTGPDQVSESQREFIDLAFRMALMSVASERGSSLVMDAPESSLDAVFAPRAADVLTRFAKPKGNRLLITMVEKSVVCLDIETGKLIWQIPYPTKYDISAVSPVYKNGMLYTTTSYGYGGVGFAMSDNCTKWKKKWTDKTLDCHHGSVINIGNDIYGSSGREWVCLDIVSGKVKYTERLVGKGSVIYVDGLFYCYGEKGMLALVKAGANGFEEISSFKIELGNDKHWAHPVVSDGVLYMRHGDTIMAFDIKAK